MSAALVDLIAPAFGGRAIASVSTRPYAYATSFALTEIHVEFGDGGSCKLILKDFARSRMLTNARRSRPRFLDDPCREIETYRTILAPERIGPPCVATVVDARADRYWLICEKVPGVELWQVGELDRWEAVFRWLSSFHEAFQLRGDEVVAANPALLRHGHDWFASWAERARRALSDSADGRAVRLRDLLRDYDGIADSLAALPTTFIHGELYPSNVMVGMPGTVDVWPIDWEMAAIGPAMLDVAALGTGWDAERMGSLLEAYGTLPGSVDDLRRCQLHLAVQWLGWSGHWRPPQSQQHDWVGEALSLAEVLVG